MEQYPFWEPHFHGARFENHTLPLDCLKDLIVLKDIIQQVAAHQFREKNHRKRIPAHFTRDVSIDIANISEGCAAISLVLNMASGLSYSSTVEAYKSAKQSVIAAVNQAETDDSITALPQSFLRLFDKLGRGLHKDEFIELDHDSVGSQHARFDITIRKRILEASVLPSEITQSISIKGRIFEIDLDKNTYGFDPMYQGKITSVIPYDYQSNIVSEIARSNQGGYILLEGVGVYKEGVLTKISEISNITELDDMDVSVRLHELAKLKPGWLDGVGVSPSLPFVKWLDELFELYYPANIPFPYIYPTAEGGVSLEWDIDKFTELSMEIDPETYHGNLYGIYKIEGKEIDEDVDLITDGWSRVSTLLDAEET